MILYNQLIKIGKTLKPHGIKGEFSVIVDAFYNIDEASCIVLCIDGIFVPFFIESVRTKGLDTYIFKVKGYDNDTDIVELMNIDLYVLKTEFASDVEEDSDIMYAEDFIGYTIIDNTGATIGNIVDYDMSTENALFIVNRYDNKEIYIPIVDEFILDVNCETTTLQMDLPIGLLEL